MPQNCPIMATSSGYVSAQRLHSQISYGQYMHIKLYPFEGMLRWCITLGTYTWVVSNWQFDSFSSGGRSSGDWAFDLLTVIDPLSTNADEIPKLSSIEVANALEPYFVTGLCHDILVFSRLVFRTNFHPPQNTWRHWYAAFVFVHW